MPEWLVALACGFELAAAVVIISPMVSSKTKAVFGCGIYGALFCVASFKAISGDFSCHCFGVQELPIWVIIAFDLAASITFGFLIFVESREERIAIRPETAVNMVSIIAQGQRI